MLRRWDSGTYTHAHARTHTHTHYAGENTATKSEALIPREKRVPGGVSLAIVLPALRPAALWSRRRALPHEGLGCGALAWLVDGLLLVKATAAAMAAA
ncbi:hypothetical protein MTO96_039936 [Rhipicephalus appendiculatus]